MHSNNERLFGKTVVMLLCQAFFIQYNLLNDTPFLLNLSSFQDVVLFPLVWKTNEYRTVPLVLQHITITTWLLGWDDSILSVHGVHV